MEKDGFNQDVELEEQNDNEEVEEVEEDEVDEESTEDTEESDEEEQDWEAEAKKWKAIAERNKKKVVKKDNKPQATGSDVDDRVAQLELAEKKRQFGYRYGLSPAEADKIFQINSDPDESTLKDPFVKAGLKALRSINRADDNSPSMSAKAQTLQRKSLSKMTPEERQAEFEKFMKRKGVIE